MTTKIQINSLEALERLIGGDAELEMELRSSVAAAFAEKHLKGMVRQMADAGLTESVRVMLDREMLDTIPDPSNPSYYSAVVKVLKQPVREALKNALDALIKEEVSRLVEQAYKDVYARIDAGMAGLAGYVANNLEPKITDQVITEKVRAKLANL